jgi:hypothetical protein
MTGQSACKPGELAPGELGHLKCNRKPRRSSVQELRIRALGGPAAADPAERKSQGQLMQFRKWRWAVENERPAVRGAQGRVAAADGVRASGGDTIMRLGATVSVAQSGAESAAALSKSRARN